MRRAAMAVALGALFLCGCGPSLRMVQQSRRYFERCYAADLDARIPSWEKRECWAAWLRFWAEGQPLDHIRYARMRLLGIERGERVPGRHAGDPAGAGGIFAQSGSDRSVQVPTDPALEVLDRSQGDDRAPALDAAPVLDREVALREREGEEGERPRRRRIQLAPPRTENEVCGEICEPTWRSCLEGCPNHEGDCRSACRAQYQNCARSCF